MNKEARKEKAKIYKKLNKEKIKRYNENYRRLEKEGLAPSTTYKKTGKKTRRRKYSTKVEAIAMQKIQNKIYKNSPKAKEVQKKYRQKPEIKKQTTKNNREISMHRVNSWLQGDSLPYFKYKISYLKSRCKRENIKFDLSIEHLVDVAAKQHCRCYYTEMLLRPYFNEMDGNSKRPGKKKSLDGRFTQISIDRIKPEKGYVNGNVVIVADIINSMKSNFSEEQFKSVIGLISKNHKIDQNYRSKDFKELYKKIIKN